MHIRMRLRQWMSFLALVLVVLLCGLTTPERLAQSVEPAPVVLSLPDLPASPQIASESAEPKLTAEAVLAMDINSGFVLFQKNADAPLPPASSLKLLTALTARELFKPDEVASISAYGILDSKQPLHSGLSITVEELLAALVIESNNTAAYALANHDPAGYTHFIETMNDVAAKLGLQETRAYNPAGFDDSLSRSSARDLSLLIRLTMQDQLLRGMLSSPTRQAELADGRILATLHNTNILLRTDSRFYAGKTGTTDEAGQVLVALAHLNQHPVVLVLMGSSDRYTEMRLLADWIEGRYTWVTPDLSSSRPVTAGY